MAEAPNADGRDLSWDDVVPVDTIGLEVGYRLIPLVDKNQGGQLMSRIKGVRRKLTQDVGFLVPPVHIRDNLQLAPNAYRITLAVAGFSQTELKIEVKEQTLSVSGEKAEESEDKTYLHRGIAARAFERRFQLADHVDVTGAKFENGLLHVDLVRNVPESKKPRTISIGIGEPVQQLEAKAA